MALNPTVLITGGSSGIGYTISRHFAADGYRILWVSLLEQELREAREKLQSEYPDCEVQLLTQDLSEENGAQIVYDWCQAHQYQVDVLINNAGFGTFGFLQDISEERELAMIQLNVLNLYKMCRRFLPDMLQRNAGTIINISSNSSFQPTPKLTTYSSTKSFVQHFSRGLNEELKIQKSKVKVICVCPSAIQDTQFKNSGNMEKVNTFTGMASTTAAEVAKDVWRGFQSGKNFIVTGWKMRMLYKIRNLVPYRLQQMVVRKEVGEAK